MIKLCSLYLPVLILMRMLNSLTICYKDGIWKMFRPLVCAFRDSPELVLIFFFFLNWGWLKYVGNLSLNLPYQWCILLLCWLHVFSLLCVILIITSSLCYVTRGSSILTFPSSDSPFMFCCWGALAPFLCPASRVSQVLVCQGSAFIALQLLATSSVLMKYVLLILVAQKIYLKEWQGTERSSNSLFIPQIPTTNRPGPGLIQDSYIPFFLPYGWQEPK